jgi:hypothetical protein
MGLELGQQTAVHGFPLAFIAWNASWQQQGRRQQNGNLYTPSFEMRL